VEFRVLGPLEVRDGDRVVFSGAGKPGALLALLLLHANEVVSTDRLLDELWGERPPRTAAKSLQTYVSQLRRVLGDVAIATRGHGYVLSVAAGACDAGRFRELVARGDHALAEGEPETAATTLHEALALWRGPVLGELGAESWARAEVERLEEERLQALEARIEAELALGRHAAVIGELTGLTRQHPLREHLLGLLMLALYRCGRQADALEAYRTGRRRLRDELGIEPTPELRRLEQEILRQDPELSAPPAPARRLVAGSSPRRLRRLLALSFLVSGAVAASVWLAVGRGSSSRGVAAADTAVLVSASGKLGSAIPVGASPGHALSAGGYLWTSNERDGTVSRVDVGSRTVETIPVGRSPEGLAFANGHVWVANGSDATVSEIDPRAGKVVRTLHVGNGPLGLAARGPMLWVANSVDGTLARIDSRSGRATRVAVGSRPVVVAAGPDAVWVALAGSGVAAKLDREGRRVVETINVGNAPDALALQANHVWVANEQDGTLSRIDSASGTVDATVLLGGSPRALVATAGAVWATLADGRVARVDARSARLLERFRVGGEPAALVPADSDVWVSMLRTPASHRGGTLRVLGEDVAWCACVDPVFAAPTPEQPLDLVYDGLVAYRRVGGPAGSTLVPDLALSLPTPTDEGRTYVFRLRPGVRFSNGRPVRATDVRASFIRLFRINPPVLFPVYSPDGGRCSPGKPCNLSRHIVADDRAGTVTFHLAKADPEFLYKLALPIGYVVPADSPRKMARRPLPGTGPYRIASFLPNRRLVLERNLHFHVFAPDATPDGFPDRVVITLGLSTPKQLAAVEHRSADVATPTAPLPPQVQGLELRYASQLHADSMGTVEYMFLNTRVPPFDQLDARRAVNEAIDRKRLVEILGGPDAATPTCQSLPPGFPGYQPYCPYGSRPTPTGTSSAPNLSEARKLVARSGTRGQDVLVWAPADHAAVATYMARVLRQIGYRAQPHIVGTRGNAVYFNRIGTRTDPSQFGWEGWIRDYTSAADFLRPLFACSAFVPGDPGATTNESRFCAPRVEAAMRTAERLQLRDSVAASRAWARVDRMIVDRAAAVPYANDLQLTLLSRRVGNYQFNPQWGVLLDQLWVR
jgi:YVTN family beta-propeller protein